MTFHAAFPHRPVAQPSPREVQCLALSLEFGRKGAAHRLGIQEQTVKNNLTSLYKRLDVTSASQAAIALDWLRIPSHLSGHPGIPGGRQDDHARRLAPAGAGRGLPAPSEV